MTTRSDQPAIIPVVDYGMMLLSLAIVVLTAATIDLGWERIFGFATMLFAFSGLFATGVRWAAAGLHLRLAVGVAVLFAGMFGAGASLLLLSGSTGRIVTLAAMMVSFGAGLWLIRRADRPGG